MRAIDKEAGGSCTALERPLDWKREALPGPAGPAGPPGAGAATTSRYKKVPWGSIGDGASPVTVLAVDGVGSFVITRCAADGTVRFAYKNTTAGTTRVSERDFSIPDSEAELYTFDPGEQLESQPIAASDGHGGGMNAFLETGTGDEGRFPEFWAYGQTDAATHTCKVMAHISG